PRRKRRSSPQAFPKIPPGTPVPGGIFLWRRPIGYTSPSGSGMKELTAEFVRQEVARLGEVVVETAIYHPSGMKLFSAGDVITLSHAKALHSSGIRMLYLLEFEEDARLVRKALGIERIAPKDAAIGDVVMDDLRGVDGELAFPSGTTITSATLDRL